MNTVKYVGPEITSDATLAELCGTPDHHLQVYCSWEQGTIDIEAVRDGCTSYSGDEYNGHAESWRVDILSAMDTWSMVKELTPIVAQLHAAHSTEWDGNNHVARYSLGDDELDSLRSAAHDIISEARQDAVGGVWDAADYCEADPPVVDSNTDLDELAAELQSAAHQDGIHLHCIHMYLEELLETNTSNPDEA